MSAAEKLPPIKTIDSLPSGEREMLRRQSLITVIDKMQKPRHRVRQNGHLLPEA